MVIESRSFAVTCKTGFVLVSTCLWLFAGPGVLAVPSEAVALSAAVLGAVCPAAPVCCPVQ